jgi:MFS family permease
MYIFHPATRMYRFIVLIFVSLITFGSYFAYDIIGAIAPTLVEDLGAERGTIGTFYTMYSIAAILSVLIGGILLDRFGIRLSSLLFSTLVFIGSVLVALPTNLTIIFLGRFIFGAGSEPLVVAQMAMLSRWFKNKELALSFGITLTVSRLGTLFSFNTGELISSYYHHYRYALIAASLFCLLSLLSNIAYIYLDRRGERILQLKSGGETDKINFKDIASFNRSYWYVTILCVTFYSAIFPFTALSTDFFVDKWGVARVGTTGGSFLHQVLGNFFHMFSTAGGISSIIIFASMVFAPFAGHLVDKIGRRASLMIIGSILMIPAHSLMGLTKIYPVYPMIALGAAFVLVPAAMWPSIPLLVPKEKLGTAFGLTTMIQNIGLALFPFLNGTLRDITKSYTASMLMFASLGFVGLIFAILLLHDDKKHNNILEKP